MDCWSYLVFDGRGSSCDPKQVTVTCMTDFTSQIRLTKRFQSETKGPVSVPTLQRMLMNNGLPCQHVTCTHLPLQLTSKNCRKSRKTKASMQPSCFWKVERQGCHFMRQHHLTISTWRRVGVQQSQSRSIIIIGSVIFTLVCMKCNNVLKLL